jgi:hypothetical protein
MRKNMLSPNFKKNANRSRGSKQPQNYRLYTNIPRASEEVRETKTRINKQTLDMMSPCQDSMKQFTDKHSLNRKRTEKLLEYNEGIKEVDNMGDKLEEIWSLFEFEKNILLMDISSFLKLNRNSEFKSKSHILLEGLEHFFGEVRHPSDLLEVPANQMVSEILKSESMGSFLRSQDFNNESQEMIPRQSLISKSVQVLLTAAQIKESLSQRLMIEKICENKELQIRHYDSVLHLYSLDKKLHKQKEKLKSSIENLKCTAKERDELRKLLGILIEKSGTLSNGVNALFRIMESNNDMQKNLQMIASRGSPLGFLLSENQHFGLDKDKTKSLAKENYVNNDGEVSKFKSIFSPLKRNQVNGGGLDSDKDMNTPKTATFAEISKRFILLTKGHNNSPDTGYKQSDFKPKLGGIQSIPFYQKSGDSQKNKINTRLFSEKKIPTEFPNKIEDFSLNDFAKQVGSKKLFKPSKVFQEERQSKESNTQNQKINPKISNPNNISNGKSGLDKSIHQVFNSLSQFKGSPLPLKKKENLSNPSTFILKNLTSLTNSIYSETQQESLQNNTLFEVNKILTLGRQIDNSENLNHRGTKFRKGSSLSKENSQSVIKDIFQDDLSFITGKTSLNNKNDSISSKQRYLNSKLSGNSEIISRILKNFPHEKFPSHITKFSTGFDNKVKVTSDELKQKLDKMKSLGDSFIEAKNFSAYMKTIKELQQHFNKSSNEESEQMEVMKFDTGSRIIDCEDTQARSNSRILSTQTGNQKKEREDQSEMGQSPERQILPMDLIEVTSYSKIQKGKDIIEFECSSPQPSNTGLKSPEEATHSSFQPVSGFQSGQTISTLPQEKSQQNKMTEKKMEEKNYVKQTFSSSKKVTKKRRYSNNRSTNKKEMNRKSYSTQKKIIFKGKSKSKSPSKHTPKKTGGMKWEVRQSLWRNDKKQKPRNIRHLVGLMKKNDYSKMNIKNLKSAFMNRGVPNYTTSHLKKFS